MNPFIELNVVTVGDYDENQKTKIISKLNELIADSDFSEVTFEFNGSYIGGHPKRH